MATMASSRSTRKKREKSPDMTEKLYETLKLIVSECKEDTDNETKELIAEFKKLGTSGAFKERKVCRPVDPFRLLKLLHRCLTSHRFRSAACVLEALCLETAEVGCILFKGALQAIENTSPEAADDGFEHFTRYLSCLKLPNKREIALEVIMHYLRQHLFQKARTFLQHNSHIWHPNLRQNSIIDALLKGYSAMLDYLEWKKLMIAASENAAEVDITSNDTYARKAIVGLKEAVAEDGIWDIFIVKLIEILEFYGNISEAEIILEQYVDYKENHLPAYIYEYEFFKKHNLSFGIRLHCLEKITSLSPSDKYVLEYVMEIRNCDLAAEEKYRRCLNLLFNFVDYPHNKDNLEAWKLLAIVLSESEKLEYLKHVDALWKTRKSYWPTYHFSLHCVHVNRKADAKLLIVKAHVATFLHFDNNLFLDAVATLLRSSNYSEKYSERIKEFESRRKRPKTKSSS